jgi:hypothetical protein
MTKIGWLTITLLFCYLTSIGQPAAIKGQVKDAHNEEPIPFASVVIKPARLGVISDSLGFFTIPIEPGTQIDSLEVTYVGYDKFIISLQGISDSSFLKINLARAVTQGVVIKSKADRGLILWRKIVRNKPRNDRARYSYFGYELHNKLELDFNRVNKEKLEERKFVKPFSFILDNIDSSDGGPPILPVFLTETLSDYFFRLAPRKTREVIKASKTNGVNNESVTKLLGGMYQNVNVYANFIPVFDKQFVSPLSSQGDNYYVYSTPDTIMLNGRRFYHWIFSPKRKGENTFEGDAWVHDSSFAIQRIQLRLTGLSTVNHIENLSIYQDYSLINDSTWFLSKDKFIADVYPIGKNNFGMKGRKTTTYRNITFDRDVIDKALMSNRLAEEVVVLPGAEEKTKSYWDEARHEALTKNEAGIYKMIDTLQQMPLFKKYTNTLSFITTGYKPIGNFEIGPWFNWVTLNAWEGLRTRFDLGTTPGFSPDWYLHGYLAYGFGDKTFKGKAEAYYFLNKEPRSYLHATYLNDIDNGQNYYDEVSLDNIFALAIRKQGIPIKFMQVEMQELEYYTSTRSGFSVKLGLQHKNFNPLDNIPGKENFPSGKGAALNNFEAAVTLRFSYLEKFLQGNYFRVSLGSDYPTVELQYHKGFSGVLNSNYDYHKLKFRINDYFKIAPFGTLDINIYGGKTFGTLPYMLLEVAPGNEIYYYNKYAFNLMNRFEYINDRYAGFAIEHNFGPGIFKYTGITRKLKWRQFWNVKTLVGGLSDENYALNFVPGHPFQNLDGKMYIEGGTGIDNILKVLRLDLIWRFGPKPLPDNWVGKFGVFGSFRLAF